MVDVIVIKLTIPKIAKMTSNFTLLLRDSSLIDIDKSKKRAITEETINPCVTCVSTKYK
jgi:hypothetical protein